MKRMTPEESAQEWLDVPGRTKDIIVDEIKLLLRNNFNPSDSDHELKYWDRYVQYLKSALKRF